MTENLLVKQLHEIALKLTHDLDVQKELMQEMFVHLVRVQTAQPGEALTWYLKSCEFHARHHLNPALVSDDERPVAGAHSSSPSVGQIEIEGKLITDDVAKLILPHLSDKQQQVLFLLMKGCGVREAGRELGIN